jgi:hypothetical protein
MGVRAEDMNEGEGGFHPLKVAVACARNPPPTMVWPALSWIPPVGRPVLDPARRPPLLLPPRHAPASFAPQFLDRGGEWRR